MLWYYSNLKPPVIYSNVSLILSINLSKKYPGNNIGPKIIIYGTIKRPIILSLLFFDYTISDRKVQYIILKNKNE